MGQPVNWLDAWWFAAGTGKQTNWQPLWWFAGAGIMGAMAVLRLHDGDWDAVAWAYLMLVHLNRAMEALCARGRTHCDCGR